MGTSCREPEGDAAGGALSMLSSVGLVQFESSILLMDLLFTFAVGLPEPGGDGSAESLGVKQMSALDTSSIWGSSFSSMLILRNTDKGMGLL